MPKSKNGESMVKIGKEGLEIKYPKTSAGLILCGIVILILTTYAITMRDVNLGNFLTPFLYVLGLILIIAGGGLTYLKK